MAKDGHHFETTTMTILHNREKSLIKMRRLAQSTDKRQQRRSNAIFRKIDSICSIYPIYDMDGSYFIL